MTYSHAVIEMFIKHAKPMIFQVSENNFSAVYELIFKKCWMFSPWSMTSSI